MTPLRSGALSVSFPPSIVRAVQHPVFTHRAVGAVSTLLLLGAVLLCLGGSAADAQRNPRSMSRTARRPDSLRQLRAERADDLFREAKRQFRLGELRRARQFVSRAIQVRGVASPEETKFLNELKRQQRNAAQPESRHETPDGPKAELQRARGLIAQGKLDDAEFLAHQVAQRQHTYGLFDDNPELVLESIRELRRELQRQQPRRVTNPIPPRRSGPRANKAARRPQRRRAEERPAPVERPVDTEPPIGTRDLERARELLAQARQEIAAYRFPTASALIDAVDKLDVVYELFDDRPDLARRDLEAMIVKAQREAARLANTPDTRPTEAQSNRKPNTESGVVRVSDSQVPPNSAPPKIEGPTRETPSTPPTVGFSSPAATPSRSVTKTQSQSVRPSPRIRIGLPRRKQPGQIDVRPNVAFVESAVKETPAPQPPARVVSSQPAGSPSQPFRTSEGVGLAGQVSVSNAPAVAPDSDNPIEIETVSSETPVPLAMDPTMLPQEAQVTPLFDEIVSDSVVSETVYECTFVDRLFGLKACPQYAPFQGVRHAGLSSGDEGIGHERVALAPFQVDISQPINNVRVRLDAVYDMPTPDRGELFWARPPIGPSGPAAAPAAERSLNYQDVRIWMEAGNESFSAITEIPLRVLDPVINANTAGLGPLVVGNKAVIINGRKWQITQVFRSFLNTGTPIKGLGLSHVLLEPGVLTRYRWSARTYLHGELKYLFPVGTNADHAGKVLKYGFAISHLYHETDTFAIIPTLEFSGGAFLDGLKTLPDGSVRGVDGEDFLDIHPGVRLVLGPSGDLGLFELGISGGISTGAPGFFDKLVRLELRLSR